MYYIQHAAEEGTKPSNILIITINSVSSHLPACLTREKGSSLCSHVH